MFDSLEILKQIVRIIKRWGKTPLEKASVCSAHMLTHPKVTQAGDSGLHLLLDLFPGAPDSFSKAHATDPHLEDPAPSSFSFMRACWLS